MKTIHKRAASLLSVLAIAGTITAQTTLTGEIRPRTEYRHGYKTLIDSVQKPGIFTEQRSRLNFSYKSEKINASIILQDVRVWGSQPQLTKTDGLSSLHEAWAEYWFTKKVGIKAGRQELAYDDERLLGAVDWTQQGRSHDIFLLKYADSTFTAHAGIAYNQDKEQPVGAAYTVASSYKEMQYLWLHKQMKSLGVSVLVLNNGVQSPVSINSTRYSTTAGTYIDYKKDKLSAVVRFYYQGGVDAGKKKMSAYMGGIDVGYKITDAFSATLGVEMLSGQSQTDTTKAYKDINHAFNPLYGTGHKFNGYMDYFYVGNHLNSVGLNDAYVKVKYKKEKWWVGADAHLFMSAADVLDTKMLIDHGMYSAMSSTLGTEIDLTANYKFNGPFSMQVGYSHMLPTETLEALKGGDMDETQNWAYLMFIFKPSLLKQ